MNPAQLAAETLAAFKSAQAVPSAILKSTFSQPTSATSGINYYDLEAGAKLIYPVLTPLRNEIPRVSGKGGIQANWRAITAINPGQVSAGVSGGNRGGVIAITTQDYIAAYRGLGLESNVDFEADYAAEGFDDAKALATRVLLESLMLQEEITILGGDGAAVALGACPTPTLAASTTGGTLAAQTWSVIAYALTLEGFVSASVTAGILGQVTRVNADGSQDQFGGGSSARSTAATVATTGTTSSIAVTVAVVNGALGYALFWGAAGSETLGAIISFNSYVITAAATGTQVSSTVPNGAADNSLNSLKFDGLLYQAFKPGSNAYIATQATGTAGTGTPLTPDGEGGVVEIELALKHFWDAWRLSPTKIYISSQEQKNINKCILMGSQTASQRFVFNVEQSQIAGGTMVRSYLNKYSMNGAVSIPLEIHPNMPPGTILFFTNKLPYPLSNVGNVNQIRTRREYYQIEWPLRSRKYEYGVYCDEVLQCYAPFSLGIITNIANGVGAVNSNE